MEYKEYKERDYMYPFNNMQITLIGNNKIPNEIHCYDCNYINEEKYKKLVYLCKKFLKKYDEGNNAKIEQSIYQIREELK